MNERALIDRVRGTLREEGAEGDVYIEHRKELELRVREGKLEGLTRSEVRGLAVRAFKDGRLGFVHSTELTDEGAATATRRACGLSRSGSTREDLVLAPGRAPGVEPAASPTFDTPLEDEGRALDLYDESLASRSIAERTSWLVTAEQAARGTDPRVARTDNTTLRDVASSIWIGNTNGLERHCRKTDVNVVLEIVAEEGEDKQPGTTNLRVAHWHQLPSPAEAGRNTARKALRLLGGRPIRTGRYPVIFSPDAGWAPLVYFAGAVNGSALDRGRSWLSQRPNQTIGSELVTIRDSGRVRGASGSIPFDGEGIDTHDAVLMDRGAVSGSELDLATSARTGRPPTGNALRGGYERLPEIGSHNLYMEAGATTPEEIVASTKQGLWVWGLSGWWIGLDPSNPEFSSGASGVWIEWGKLVKPVARVTIASSLADLFKNVDAVGNDLVFDGTTKTPTYRVAEMAVSGT
jgi:PmbA protein